jgi:hypothetical protein
MYWTKSRKNISWAKKSLEDPFQARDHLGVCSHFVNHKRRDRDESWRIILLIMFGFEALRP